MITIQVIGGIVQLYEDLGFGGAFNGDNYFVFESEQEKIDYLNSLNVWTKASYIQEINDAHNLLFESYYKSKDYLTIGEISLWVTDETYGQEATDLINWWRLTCEIVKEYLNNVTEETVIEDFLTTLPQLNG